MSESEKKRFFIPMLLLACSVAFVNVYFRENYIISLAVVLVEIAILIFCFFKNIKYYLFLYILFICNCLEFSTAVGSDSFYGLKNFRVFGVNLGAILMLPLIIVGFLNIFKIRNIENSTKNRFVSILLIINTIAAITGVFLIVVNNNNITHSFDNVFSLFFGKMYEMLFIPLSLGLTIPLFIRDKKFKAQFSLILEATLLASVFQIITSVVFKQYGTYSTIDTLQMSLISVFVPFLMLLSLDKEFCCFPKMCFIFSIIGSVLTVFYNPSGKMIIIFALSFFIFIVQMVRKGNGFKKVFASVLLVCVLLSLPFVYSYMMNSALFGHKIGEVLSIINIFSDEWLSNMSLSPRIRVEEFRAIFVEYEKMPFLAVFGKGYLGSITDVNGFFYQSLSSTDGFVSNAEWASGVFYNLHEGASILLMYGLFGLGFIMYTFIKLIKQYVKSMSPYTLIGALWFLLFYGYSFTLGIFGFSCIIYGLYYASSSQKVLKCVYLEKTYEMIGYNDGLFQN